MWLIIVDYCFNTTFLNPRNALKWDMINLGENSCISIWQRLKVHMDRNSLPTGTVTFLFTDIEGSMRLLQELRLFGTSQALLDAAKVPLHQPTCWNGSATTPMLVDNWTRQPAIKRRSKTRRCRWSRRSTLRFRSRARLKRGYPQNSEGSEIPSGSGSSEFFRPGLEET